MTSLTLRINIVRSNRIEMMQYDHEVVVYDAMRILRERVPELASEIANEYGLFKPDEDHPVKGRWLQPGRTLGYYHFKNGDLLEYRKKMRPLRVKALDGTHRVILIDDSQNVGELIKTYCLHIGLSNPEEFSFTLDEDNTSFAASKKRFHTNDELVWLNHEMTLREQGIDLMCMLVLRQFSDKNVDHDPVQLNLLFCQSRNAIIDGSRPCTQDEAIQLAGVQCQVQYGNHNEASHKPEFLQLQQFLPYEYTKIKGIENVIFSEHRKHHNMSEANAKLRYIKLCKSLRTYGVTFFLVKEKTKLLNRSVPRLLGISKESVMRVDVNDKQVLNAWPLTTLKHWEDSANTFTLDFGDYSQSVYSVETTEGKAISQLISGYTDIIIKEKQPMDQEINQKGENEEKMQQALSLALKDGLANSSSVTIYVLGQQNAGKTCLVASLLGEAFKEQIATQGADIDVCKIFSSKWSRIEKSKMPKNLKKLYHCKLKVTAQINISAGPVLNVKNRQQLLESLPELPEAVKADLEQAKTAVLVDEDGINAIIWDFAGQSVYYGLHSMFLKEDNVAMIVFDASQPLQDPVKGRDSRKDPYTQKSISPTTTGCESVCYWLQSIHSIRKDGAPLGATSIFVPTVFLVATHIDLIGDSEAVKVREKEIIDQLVLLLEDKPFAKHIAGVENGLREALEKNCFFISNKVCNEEELDRLRSMLVEALLYIKNREHPVVFLNIEKTLLSLDKVTISTTEFHAIAHESGFFAEPDSTQLKGALTHFHSKGTILHFPQVESLKDLVVLSPDWLTKLFSYIIVAHPYKLEIDHRLQFKRLKDHGILQEDFITFMVNKFNKEQEKFGLLLSTKQAIEFAQLFGFVAEVHSNTYFLEEEYQPPVSEKRVFIVPPMLPFKLPDNVQLPDDKDPQARIVYFKFSEGFIPPMVYYQMLSACIDRNIRRQENLYWIRRHMIKMVLGYDQLYYVSLCKDHHSIRLAITPDDDGVVTPQGLQERWELIEEFNAKLMKTVKAFMPASDLPQCYIPCSLCPNLHLKLDDIRVDDKPLHCKNGKLPKDYYSDLRQYQVVHETKGAKVTGDFTMISQKVPTMKKLVPYLDKVPDWERFGYQLLPEEKEHLIQEIKRDNDDTASRKVALYRTFLQCGVRTWEQVIKALEICGHGDIAEQVKTRLLEYFSKESEDHSSKSQQESTVTETGKISTTLEPQPAASAKPQSSPVEPVSTVDTKPSIVDKDAFDCSAMAKHLKKNLPSLSNLPYKNMKLHLVANDVITHRERKEIDQMVGEDQMAEVLDILQVSLKNRMTAKFKGFVRAMEESGDTLLQETAKNLGGSKSIPDSVPDLVPDS